MLNSVKINDFLFRKRNPVDINPETEYSLVTIKLYHKGVVLREKKKGALLGSKMYRVSMGDFILSGIDARNGAFGIVPEELDGAIVTNDFWYFDIDETKVKRDFFYWLTATPLFLDACQKSSQGETQRIRLQRKLFNDFEFHFPPVDQQIEFMKNFSKIDKSLSSFSSEITNQSAYLVQLRQAILQEAIEGKVTADWRKQNPVQKSNPDFDAEALLEKIKTEKEKLIKDGKSKKQKLLVPIKLEEMPFECPKGWHWCCISQIGVVSRGKSPQYDKDGKKLIINQKCVRWFNVDVQFCKTVSLGWFNIFSEDIKTKINDVLVNSTGEGTIGRSAIVDSASTGLLFDSHVLRIKPCIEPMYIVFLVNSSFGQNQINDLKGAKSTKQTELGVNNLKNLMLPLPPLAEQKEIVKRVNRLLIIIDELEKQIIDRKVQSKKLMQSVLKEVFEGGE